LSVDLVGGALMSGLLEPLQLVTASILGE